MRRKFALLSGIRTMAGSTACHCSGDKDMSEIPKRAALYALRVFKHESTKKGVAAAGAGVLLAAVCEALWPSS